MKSEKSDNKPRKPLILRVLAWAFGILISLVLILVGLLLVPSVQTYITKQFISSIKDKSGKELSIGSIRIAFPNTVEVMGLYVQDQSDDTLLYLHSLKAEIKLWNLLSNEVILNNLSIDTTIINVNRKDSLGEFNYQFLVDAFSTSEVDTTSEPSAPWKFEIKNISLKSIRTHMEDVGSDLNFKISLGEFSTTLKNFDIEKSRIDIERIILKNTSVAFVTKKDVSVSDLADTVEVRLKDEPSDFPNVIPGWDISVDSLMIGDLNFAYDNVKRQKTASGLDNNHIAIQNFNTSINNFKSSTTRMIADIASLGFSESCGFELKNFAVNAEFTGKHVALDNLIFESGQSAIAANATISYDSYSEFLSDVATCKIKLELDNADVNCNELFILNPALKENVQLDKFRNTKIKLVTKAEGTLNDLEVGELELTILERTYLNSSFKIKNLTDVNNLKFNAKINSLETNTADIFKFIDPLDLKGLNLAGPLELTGTASGKADSLTMDLKLATSFGSVSTKGFYRSLKPGDTLNIDFEVNEIRAGYILGDTMLGNVTVHGNAAISRHSDSLLYGGIGMLVNNFGYNSYEYRDIALTANLNGNKMFSTISCADSNLTFDLQAALDSSENGKKLTTTINLSKVNLKALNLAKRNFAVSSTIQSEVNFSGEKDIAGGVSLINTHIYKDTSENEVKLFSVNGKATKEGVDVSIASEIMNGSVHSNIQADSIGHVLKSAFGLYMNKDSSAVLPDGKFLDFGMQLQVPKELISMLDSNIKDLEIQKLEGSYRTDNNQLNFEAVVPKLNYSGYILDSLKTTLTGANDKVELDLSCDKLSFNHIHVDNIEINEIVQRGTITSSISTKDSSENIKYLFANEIVQDKDYLRFKFLPEGLVLNGTTWTTAENNYFEVRNKTAGANRGDYVIQDFTFEAGDRSFGIATIDGNKSIVFRNFEIQDVLNIATYQDSTDTSTTRAKLIRGNIEGDIILPAFPAIKDVNVKLAVKDLYVLDSLAGDLSVNVNVTGDILNIDLKLQNKENKIMVNGVINQYSEKPVLDLNVLLDIGNIKSFERYTFGSLSEMGGGVNGKINIQGPAEQPDFTGELEFKETVFKVNSLNFLARLRNEKVVMNNKGLHFENFVIEDAEKKKLTLKGDVFTNKFKKVEFDLNLVTDKFQPVNSTVKNNPVFYGKLSMGADINLKGDMKNLAISANIKIDSLTDLTYALPGSELKLVTSEGIVEFRDSAEAAASSEKGDYITDSLIARMEGLNLKAHVELDPGVKITIDVDPKSGDYLTLKGGAKLDISSSSSAGQSMNGVYEVNSGIYQLSFYDLVKKDFIIKPGSTVAWSGRPMDADMNITAEYVVRTSSVALIANETTTMSEEEKKIFNKRLPYEVKLNIRGFLSKPEISFNISLPSQYLSDNPLIEAKLRQLNTPDMAPQLNKQVFALLVAGTFMAESPMDAGGSNNIATTAARNSVNGILASQLNNMSGKYISGVDVNFGITSYDDYDAGSSSSRTEMDIQVSKKLFNDRVTVEAENSFGLTGSKKQPTNSTTAQGYGQFAVIYNLTETGEYRLRAYYQNAYDPFDGDISYSGIAVIFEKELDSLWPAAGQTNETNKQ